MSTDADQGQNPGELAVLVAESFRERLSILLEQKISMTLFHVGTVDLQDKAGLWLNINNSNYRARYFDEYMREVSDPSMLVYSSSSEMYEAVDTFIKADEDSRGDKTFGTSPRLR